jgi:hypothetical protein
MLVAFIKMCREDPNLLQLQQKRRTHYMITATRLIVASDLTIRWLSATRGSVVQWSSSQLRFSGNAFGICIVARTYGNTVYVNHTKNSMLRFPCNNGNANAPQCYAVCTLPLSFIWSFLYDAVCY